MARIKGIVSLLLMFSICVAYGGEFVFELAEATQLGSLQSPSACQIHIKAFVKVGKEDDIVKFTFSEVAMEKKGEFDELFTLIKPEMMNGLAILFKPKEEKAFQFGFPRAGGSRISAGDPQARPPGFMRGVIPERNDGKPALCLSCAGARPLKPPRRSVFWRLWKRPSMRCAWTIPPPASMLFSGNASYALCQAFPHSPRRLVP